MGIDTHFRGYRYPCLSDETEFSPDACHLVFAYKYPSKSAFVHTEYYGKHSIRYNFSLQVRFAYIFIFFFYFLLCSSFLLQFQARFSCSFIVCCLLKLQIGYSLLQKYCSFFNFFEFSYFDFFMLQYVDRSFISLLTVFFHYDQ